MHTTSMPPVAASLSSALPIRRSTRPRQRTSRYFSMQEGTSSVQSATSTSRHYLSSTAADVENMKNASDSDAIKKSAPAAIKKSIKGITSGPYTVSKSATTAKVASKSKRKAKTTSKNTTTTTKKKKAKKAKTKSTTPIERTRSFEPVWWGNVLTTNTKTSLHPHAAAIAAGKSNTPTPTPTATTTTPETYPPVHTLILGTHPSIASLSKNEMYGHPLNAFWYLAGDALGFRRSSAISPKTGKPYVYFHEYLRHSNGMILDYPQQLERMCGRGFAMWDIVAECEREGSLDTDIEGEVANPIREFCEGTMIDGGGDGGMMSEYLGIKRIVISNGTTGSKFFVKHFTDWFVDGKLFAAGDDMSQRVFKTVMNKARKANGNGSVKLEEGEGIEVVCLPGVSPAAAKFTYLEKRDAWEKGCYGPGLADYEEWKDESRKAASIGRQQLKTPDSKRSKSPRRSATTPSPSKKGSVRIVSSDLATMTPENKWVDLEVPARELRPSATLTNGQCFNWLVVGIEPAEVGDGGSTAYDDVASPQKQQQSAWGTHDAKEWIGPLQNRVISIRETPTTTLFRVLHGPSAGTKDDLRHYFRLETPLAPLYEEWSRADARLAKIATAIPGVRILRQDPLECMFSFICSSNNNIPRIAKMLSSFRERYGTFMMDIPARGDDNAGGSVSSVTVFSFPTLASLAHATEEELRGMGLGYRAKFIIETRNLLVESGGNDFLLNLRTQRDAEAVQEELIKFSGIGRKVADCVALFSLDQDDAIPVDVHVQHIASRDYDPTVLGEAKSITPTIYKRVGDLFRERFDSYPGWAHSLLFVAELPSFRGILPADMVREMDEWKEHEQRKKLEKKEASKKAKAK